MNQQHILVENNLVAFPTWDKPLDDATLATILSNIAYYGYALSESAYAQLRYVEDIEGWWTELEVIFKKLTGADKKMSDFVVYKNFPREVLEMSEAEYWLRQVLMYWGFPNEYFTEETEPREYRKEQLPLKVLQPADDRSLDNIFASLLRSPVKWTARQKSTVKELATDSGMVPDLSGVPFKENLVALAIMLMGHPVHMSSATDVLRLAVGLSDGDVSLRTNTKFRRFKRPERRFLLGLLDGCRNLEEDVARRRGPFKRLFFELRPGDYNGQFPKVVTAYDNAYRGAKVATFNSMLEELLAEKDDLALDLLRKRPGEFMRRLRVVTNTYGADAVEAFKTVMPKLSVHQLVKLERHLMTANDRSYRTFPPKGNWTRLQVKKTEKKDLWHDNLAIDLYGLISAEVGRRVGAVFPSVNLSVEVDKVKLQGNDADLTPYGRGTTFNIPDNIKFLRSASYWKTGGARAYDLWYDNGWNFFDDNWKSMGTCCWNLPHYGGASFSGDPTNSKDLQGRACQMIDLYLDQLEQLGVRYAVWNILCYSRKSFDEAEEVQAALQWGEKAQTNKLFEPSRCVFSSPVRGANLTKYIAYVDIKKRQLVYMDANLKGQVESAGLNEKKLSETMPAFVEYLDSLPSVYDLFKDVERSAFGTPVVYDDDSEPVTGQAYVFSPRNQNSDFEAIDLNALLKK